MAACSAPPLSHYRQAKPFCSASSPLGEPYNISAFCTDSFQYRFINHTAHAFKFFINISVAETHNTQTIPFKHLCSFRVIRFAVCCIVLRSIQLYHKSSLMAVKICNKIFYDSLFIYFYGIIFQKIIPQMSFLRSHTTSQISCDC